MTCPNCDEECDCDPDGLSPRTVPSGPWTCTHCGWAEVPGELLDACRDAGEAPGIG